MVHERCVSDFPGLALIFREWGQSVQNFLDRDLGCDLIWRGDEEGIIHIENLSPLESPIWIWICMRLSYIFVDRT